MTTSSDSSGVLNLADLILRVKTDRGLTYAQLEEMSGAAITRQRWQQLGTGIRIKEFPEPATLSAMAEALRVQVTTVVLAAAKTIGLPVTREISDLAAMLPSGTERLSEMQRDAIVAVAKAMLQPAQDKATDEDAGATQSSTQGTGEGGVRDSGGAPIGAPTPIEKNRIGRGRPPYVDRAPGVNREKWAASTGRESEGAKLDRLDAEETDAIIRDDEGPEGGA